VGLLASPDKPTNNPFIESFNRKLKVECLNSRWFLPLAYAQDKIEVWHRTEFIGQHSTPGMCATRHSFGFGYASASIMLRSHMGRKSLITTGP
jgi:hypothetical protein